MVAQQLPSRSLNAFSDGASTTEGGSLFHGPTTQTANAACCRTCWNPGCRTKAAHASGSQLAHRNTLPEAGSCYRGITCRPWSTLSEECGSAWTKAVALVAAQDISIHVGPSRLASQAFASSPQASDLFGDTAPLPRLHRRVWVAPLPSRGVGGLLASVQQSPGASWRKQHDRARTLPCTARRAWRKCRWPRYGFKYQCIRIYNWW